MYRFSRHAVPILAAAGGGLTIGAGAMTRLEGSETHACKVKPVAYRGRQAVRIGSDQISTTVLCGGGHIALIQLPEDAAKFEEASKLPGASDEDFGSPLVS
jgi:hypothetical protein